MLGELAADLKKLLDGRNEDSLAIGEFTGPANIQTSSGPGIVQTLSEEFAKRKITVKARPRWASRARTRSPNSPPKTA